MVLNESTLGVFTLYQIDSAVWQKKSNTYNNNDIMYLFFYRVSHQQPSHQRDIPVCLDASPKPGKMGSVVAGRASNIKLFC